MAARGLGPLLWRLIDPSAAPAAADTLLGADLTAQVMTEGALDGTEEILRAAGPAAREIVLLKGIAACQRYYPEPHLRPMGDIDLLIPRERYPQLQSVMTGLKYVQRSSLPSEFYQTHHHAMPFYHPEKQLWVELHWELFPRSAPSRIGQYLSATAVTSSTVEMTFRGIPARRLNDELHLLYVCAHWAEALNIERGAIALVDVLYLLRTVPSLDWDRVRRYAGRGPAHRYLSLMLGYLLSRRAIELEPAVTDFVLKGVRKIGRVNARLLYAIIDRYMVLHRPCGRFLTEPNLTTIWARLLNDRPPYLNLLGLPWALLFPPHRADRFRLSLVAQRLWSILRPR